MNNIKTLLQSAIKNRLACEYMEKGASPAKRRYYEGRISALTDCLDTSPDVVLGETRKRYTTEKHAPGDDITYPEGTYVQWMVGRIQAAQDLIRGTGEQSYDSPVIL